MREKFEAERKAEKRPYNSVVRAKARADDTSDGRLNGVIVTEMQLHLNVTLCAE